jgi:hypothetical protein
MSFKVTDEQLLRKCLESARAKRGWTVVLDEQQSLNTRQSDFAGFGWVYYKDCLPCDEVLNGMASRNVKAVRLNPRGKDGARIETFRL